MKRLIPLIAFAIILLLSLPPSVKAEDLKIGYVRIGAVMDESDAAKVVRAELDEKVEVIKANLKVKEDELRKLVEEYQDQRAVMKEDVRKEKERVLAEKDLEYKQLVDAADRGINNDLKNYDAEMLDDIKTAVEELAEKKGYDMVFDELMGGIIYIDSKYDDLTDDVLKAYNKAYKKKNKE